MTCPSMPIYSDYIGMYFIVHLKACAAQIRERSNKLTRVPQSGVKLDVSRIDSVLENRERQIETTSCLSLSMVGFTAHSFISKCDPKLF